MIRSCQVNHIGNPVGYQLGEEPVFHWVAEGLPGKCVKESRIVVREGGTCIADTGWKELDSLGTALPLLLKPRKRYEWTVSVRSDAGAEETSGVNFFETGKMDESWAGKWIGCDDKEPRLPVFEKGFTLEQKPVSARLYVCGLGLYEAHLNGQRVGNEYLTPYCNNYTAWVQYQTFDVTDQLISGENQLEIGLGNGWYKGRFGFSGKTDGYYGDSWKLIAELRIQLPDGTETVVGTDESWQVRRSNIIFSNIYDGEQRDDTLTALPAEPARLTAPPEGKLTERLSVPVTILQEIRPVRLIHTPAGELVLDMGQNLAGIWRLHVHGMKRGARLHLQVGEVLQGGNFYRDNLRSAKAEYIYVSDGSELILEPKFTFYGYRYVKIEGMPDLQKDDFTALALTSKMRETMKLETGDAKVNRLIQNASWGRRDNFIDVPTDCPQRDERMGWTGDAQVFCPTALFFSDAYAFYSKYLYDMKTEQDALGGKVPVVVPSFEIKDNAACAWSDATCIIPWQMYRFTGDASILRRHYPAMKSWVEYVRDLEEDDHKWRDQFHYADWLALDGDGAKDSVLGGTDSGYVAEVYYLYSTRILAKTAKLLKKAEDEEIYETLANSILNGIRYEYFAPSGHCCIDTQTAYLLALRFGLSDPKRMADGLVNKLEKNGGKLQTGFVGTPLLCEQLTRIGRSDMAYDLLLNEEYPGWLYEVNLGATTIWERWNSMESDGTVSSTGMNSFNHYAYGSIVQWIAERAAGLRRKEGSVGFREAEYAPLPDMRLGHAEISYESSAGNWHARWDAEDDFTLKVSLHVPFGCRAFVRLPYAGETLYDQMRDENPLFADVKNGVCMVGGGDYEVTYHTDRPLRKIYNIDMPIPEILAYKKAASVLEKLLPGIKSRARSYPVMSLRTFLDRTSAYHLTDEQIKQLSQKLYEIR
ncbi:MAG: family 78 glycoside hydrolase catalytic domain [Lachnospiraceae bacterium]|jgi:alpha-L-rhamnosidase